MKFVFEKKIFMPSVAKISQNLENFAEIAQLVEHNLAKVGVAGSSPVFRSQIKESGIPRFFCIRVNIVYRPDGGMVDTKDLKSFGHCGCAGSSPAPGTTRG